MLKRNRQAIGILICTIVGMVILFASVFFSKVDLNPIKGNKLTDFSDEWEINVENNSYYHVQLPSIIQNVSAGDTMIVSKKLPSDIADNSYIFFRASHQKVKIYIEEELIYSFGWDDERLFSKSPACVWVLAPLDSKQSNENIRIELTGVYEKYSNHINSMYIGDKSAIIHDIVSKRIGSILICISLIIIGFCMVGITMILRKSKINASLRRLGILAMLVGSWSACTTNMLQLIYGNVYFWLNLEFFLFGLLLPIFMWFLLSFSYYNEKKGMNQIFWVAIIEFNIIEVLQLLKLADYLESILITHVTMLVGIGYIILLVGWDIIRKKAVREAKVLSFSIIVLLVFISIDLIRFYKQPGIDDGFYTRIGMLIFIGLWGAEVVRNMSKRFVYLARTKALETLAYEDLMTGLKNRTAFEEWMNSYKSDEKSEDAYIVTFDMNGLKYINDNFGHMKGDQAIVMLAKIIKSTFLPIGITYRIGGDEICVILSKANLIHPDGKNSKSLKKK